jgi:chemotaxis protein MotA
MDWASVAGLVIAILGIVIGQLIEGGNILSLVQPAPFFIVIFGTLGAVLLQSKPESFLNGVRQIKLVFIKPDEDNSALILRIAQWARIARKEGTLRLESLRDQESDLFAQKGLRLIIDGIPAEAIEQICNNDLHQYEIKQRDAIKVWDSAGGYSPTIGILAAVMGLMHVMEKLTDPSSVGSGIAVAFVATIYGVGMANLLFIPVSNKLKAITQTEVARREMIIEALTSIAAGEHTVVIEERLSAYANDPSRSETA